MDGVLSIPISERSRSDEPGRTDFGRTDWGRRPRSLGEFIAGPENRLLVTALEGFLREALAVGPAACGPAACEGPAACGELLVLYGPPGSGKSHLARGIAREVQQRRPQSRVACLAASEFADGLVDAIENRCVDCWRETFRAADLLVIDGLPQLATRPAAQGELLQTMDAVLDGGGRMVATARLAPAQMSFLSPPLRSRLSSALTLPVALPGPDARLEILERLSIERGRRLPRDVLERLAQQLIGGAQELTAAVMYLETAAQVDGRAIDLASAEAYIADQSGPQPPSLRSIAAQTARHFAVKVGDLRGPSRRQGIVTARGVAMLLARQLTPLSLQRIGEYFGGRDHTTVLHGCRKTERLVERDPETRAAVWQLRHALGQE